MLELVWLLVLLRYMQSLHIDSNGIVSIRLKAFIFGYINLPRTLSLFMDNIVYG